MESSQNFYNILEANPKASTEELKSNYQRLILAFHPDKIQKSDENSKGMFILIQEAWSVLRNPDLRRKYDAELKCKDVSEELLFDTLHLSELDYCQRNDIYTYSCRCGGKYVLYEKEIQDCEVLVGCDDCSFSILVKKNR